MCRQLGKPLRRAAFASRSAQVEEPAPTYRALGCRIAQDKAVSGSGGRRLIKHQLNQAFPTWRAGSGAEQDHSRPGRRGGLVQPEPLADGLYLGRKELERRVDPVGGSVQNGIGDHVAARNSILGNPITGKIERATVAGLSRSGRTVLRMDRTNACLQTGRRNDNL